MEEEPEDLKPNDLYAPNPVNELEVSVIKGKNMNFYKDKVTGEYYCSVCSYKSEHRSSIRSHAAVHSTDRPFACDLCTYEAKRLNDLRKHKMIRHGLKMISRSRFSSSLQRPRLEITKSGQAVLKQEYDPQMEVVSMTDTHVNVPIKRHASNLSVDTEMSEAYSGEKIMRITRGVMNRSPTSEMNSLNQSALSGNNEFKSSRPVFPGFQGDKLDPDEEDNEMSVSRDKSASPNSALENVEMGDIIEGLVRFEGGDPTMVVKPEAPPDDYYANKLREDPQSDNEEVPESPVPERAIVETRTTGMTSGTDRTPKRKSRSSSSPQRMLPSPYRNLNTMKSPPNISRVSNYFYNDSHSSTGSNSHCASSTYNQSDTRNAAAITKQHWCCEHCNILFFDNAIYFMHMGLHTVGNPWKCTVCKQTLHDVYSFTSHFVNGHSNQ